MKKLISLILLTVLVGCRETNYSDSAECELKELKKIDSDSDSVADIIIEYCKRFPEAPRHSS